MTIDQLVNEDEALEAFVDGRGSVGKPKRLLQNWSWMDTPEKARQYYEENFSGMTRNQVKHDTENRGSSFYAIVQTRRWQDQVFPPRVWLDWSWIESVDIARSAYLSSFNGLTRKQLQKDAENCGAEFYSVIRTRGWIDQVFPPKTRADWLWMDTPEKARKHYLENFDGMTRSQVLKDAENGGRAFYAIVRIKGWLNEVFPPSQRRNWSWMDTPEKAREYYNKNFKGMTRKEVDDDTRKNGNSFYHAVIRKGWQDLVFPKDTRRIWSWMDNYQKAREHYENNYAGMTRKQVQDDSERGGRRFYRAVRKRGWVEQVFPPSRHNDWSWMDTPEKAREYYNTNFRGKSRGQVSTDFKTGGCSFYSAVPKEWRDYVFPPSKRRKRA